MRIADLYLVGKVGIEWLVERTIGRLPISPLALTLSGVVTNVVAAGLLAWGYLRWGAGVLLLAGTFDAVDGAQARVTGRQSTLGAFLDATLDRYSEALIGLGLLIHLLQQGTWLDLVLLYLFVAGSLIFSYTRARAEAEGFDRYVGLFTRPVRVVVLVIGLLAGQLRITLWLVAVAVQISALHRLLGVCLGARKESAPKGPTPFQRWVRGLRS